jgi:hypothetical protein
VSGLSTIRAAVHRQADDQCIDQQPLQRRGTEGGPDPVIGTRLLIAHDRSRVSMGNNHRRTTILIAKGMNRRLPATPGQQG